MRLVSVLALAGALLCFAGCGRADKPPTQTPPVSAPELETVSSDVPAAIRVKVQPIAANSFERRAKRMTVRVRNVSCLGIGVGSGFAIGRDLLVTNRHVLAGADELEVSTWDGRTLDVRTAKVGALGDIGVAVVDGRLPQVGTYGRPPGAGAAVTVAGYPLGEALALRLGTVVDYVDGWRFDVPGRVLRLRVRVQPGSSGGPVLDRQGKVIAVVFALDLATRYGLAIPVDTLRKLIRDGGYEAVPPCGSD